MCLLELIWEDSWENFEPEWVKRVKFAWWWAFPGCGGSQLRGQLHFLHLVHMLKTLDDQTHRRSCKKKSWILHRNGLSIFHNRVMVSHSPQQPTHKQRSSVMDEVLRLPVCLATIDEEGGHMEQCPSSSPCWRMSHKTFSTVWDSSPMHGPLLTEGHQGVSAEHVLRAWGQPYLVSSPGSSAGFTYLMRFYGFRHCKLYSLSQTSKTFLHLSFLTCQVSLGML